MDNFANMQNAFTFKQFAHLHICNLAHLLDL
jgi:hypothetical protein